MGIVCFTLNPNAKECMCKVQLLVTALTLMTQMSRRKVGLKVWWIRWPPCLCCLSLPPVRLGYWTLWLLSQPASRHTVSVALSKQIDLISRHMMCKGLCWRKGCDVRFWCCHQRAKPLSPWSVQPPRLPPSSPPSHPPPPPHPRLFLAQRTGSLPRYIGSR